jgi:flagellar basal body-associated protein FliL
VKKKILIAVPVLLIGLGVAYKLVLAPKPVPVKHKIEGAVVPLQKEFLLNLNGGRYAKVSVALVMPAAPAAAHSGGEAAAGLPQEAAVRAIVTDRITGLDASALIQRHARHELLKEIRKAIAHSTDEEVDEVFFTDITVQ